MTRILLVAVTALSLLIGYTAPADACGVKLTVKAPRVKKKVKPSDNPSRILLVGEPPRRLKSSLSEAGHSVDVADEPDEAKRQRYAVVIADRDKVQESRSAFPRSRVIARSGSTRANLRAVEQTLAGEPSGNRDRMIARKNKRSRQARRRAPQPRRATPTREIARAEVPAPTGASDGQAVTGVASLSNSGEPSNQKTALVTLPRKDEPREENPREEDVQPEEKPAEVAKNEPKFTDELFFGPNSVRLSKRNRIRLAANAKWLAMHPEVSIRVEGHTDSAGPAEYNMTLGERRAEAVKEFLVSRGVDSSRIDTISHGEDQPAYSDRDSKNRRVAIAKQ